MNNFWFEDNSKNFWEYDQNGDSEYDDFKKSTFVFNDYQTRPIRESLNAEDQASIFLKLDNTTVFKKNKDVNESKQNYVNQANSTVYSSFLNPAICNYTHYSEQRNYESQLLNKDSWIQNKQEKSNIESTLNLGFANVLSMNNKDLQIEPKTTAKQQDKSLADEILESVSISENVSEPSTSKNQHNKAGQRRQDAILRRWNRSKDKQAFSLLYQRLAMINMDILEFFTDINSKIIDDKKKIIIGETRLSVIEGILIQLNWGNTPYFLFKRFQSLVSKQTFSTRELIHLRKILRKQKEEDKFDINEISYEFPGKFYDSIQNEANKILNGRF